MAGAVTKVEATFRPRSKLLPHSAMGGRRRCHAKPARVRARDCDGVFRLLCRRGDYSRPWSDYTVDERAAARATAMASSACCAGAAILPVHGATTPVASIAPESLGAGALP